MSQGTNRREFLAQGGAFAAGGLWLAGSGAKALGYAANEKLNVAVIGVRPMLSRSHCTNDPVTAIDPSNA